MRVVLHTGAWAKDFFAGCLTIQQTVLFCPLSVDTNTTFVWRTCSHPDLPMPAYARCDIVDEDRVGVYHCIARCVRRAFLCGTDSYTGRDYGHRKAWVLDRLRQLAGLFGVEVCDYAIMSNHLHTTHWPGDPRVRSSITRSACSCRTVDARVAVDWTGREIRENKCGAIPDNLAPILDRLGLDRSNWVKTVANSAGCSSKRPVARVRLRGRRRVARDGGFREGRRPKPLLSKDAD